MGGHVGPHWRVYRLELLLDKGVVFGHGAGLLKLCEVQSGVWSWGVEHGIMWGCGVMVGVCVCAGWTVVEGVGLVG